MKSSHQKGSYLSFVVSIAALSLIAAGCSSGAASPAPSPTGDQQEAVLGNTDQNNQGNSLGGPDDASGTRSGDSESATSSRRFGRGNFTSGTIAKKNDDGSGLTLTLRDGSTKDITVDSSTVMQRFDSQTQKQTSLTFADLKTGDVVFVSGTTTSDGAYRAVSIREGMPMRGPGGQGGRPGDMGGSPPQQ